ncbi:cation transmembrane transporter [Fragilaria crotonensis]|nr:cation transmembrane transporter [Fragilaria crotonensis]
MVRGNAAPTRSAPPSLTHPGQAYEHNRGTPYRADINTPVKVGAPPPSRIPPSQSRHPSPFHTASSISGRQPVSISASASRYPPAQPNPNLPTPTSAHRPPRVASTPSEKSTVSSSDRRNPCNCKKSKCLKLYCECFAAELVCDGCNCNDCRNNIEHEDIRNKAMKDTRAKNPNAFKPRIIARVDPRPTGATPQSAHNMGCKCKRSECLKKYCECFQAGVMCGNKCKCVDCLNYVGSQALIDKRRKIRITEALSLPCKQPMMLESAPPGPPPHYMGHPSMAHPPVGYPTMGMAMHHQGSSSHAHAQQSSGNVSKSGRQSESATATTKPPPRAASVSNKTNVSEPKSVTTTDAPETAKTVATPVAEKKMNPTATLGVAEPVRLMSTPPVEPNATSVSPPISDPPLDTVMSDPDPKDDEFVAGSEPVDTLESSSTELPPATPIVESKPRQPDLVALTDDKSSKEPPPTQPFQPVQPDEVMEMDESLKEAHPSTPTEALKPFQCQVEEVVEASVGLHPVSSSEASQPVLPEVALEINEAIKESRPESPTVTVPRTPGVRLGYDPYSSKQKRQLSPGQKEATLPYFGELPEQPKTTALAVFSFLSNDEIYNAGLVCKQWSRLAMDEELWQF